MTGWLPRRKPDRRWTYTLAAAAREEAGSLMMEEYIRRQQNTAAQYIAKKSLLELCKVSERALGEQLEMWWWKQAGFDLKEARE